MFKTWIIKEPKDLAIDAEQDFFVVAFYHLHPIESPEEMVKAHQAFFQDKDVKGRIYLAKQGINGTLSAKKEGVSAYINWLWSMPEFKGAEFKIQEYHDHAFGKLIVKTRLELVALGHEVDLNAKGPHLTPKEWRTMFEEEEDKIVVDVRNAYEWELGRFVGAESVPCETFRDFIEYAKELKERINPEKTKVLMYCTGGIRCEFFSALLMEEGIQNVFQLQGGVIKYGAEEQSKHWQGKLFVFDDRLSVPISSEETEVVGRCHHCEAPADRYFNCANMDCNNLFICCDECLKNHYGCCKQECREGSRVRPFKLASTPFRKWYTYAKTKEDLNSLKAPA